MVSDTASADSLMLSAWAPEANHQPAKRGQITMIRTTSRRIPGERQYKSSNWKETS